MLQYGTLQSDTKKIELPIRIKNGLDYSLIVATGHRWNRGKYKNFVML